MTSHLICTIPAIYARSTSILLILNLVLCHAQSSPISLPTREFNRVKGQELADCTTCCTTPPRNATRQSVHHRPRASQDYVYGQIHSLCRCRYRLLMVTINAQYCLTSGRMKSSLWYVSRTYACMQGECHWSHPGIISTTTASSSVAFCFCDKIAGKASFTRVKSC